MTDLTLADKDYNLWWLLSQTTNAIAKARRKELHRYSIRSGRASVLFMIEAIGEETTPSQMARWLCRESHSVSELVSRMEKEGLVRKVKDLPRKDQVRVIATNKGRKMYHEATERESIKRIMSCLSQQEQKQLRSSLRKLRDEALKEVGSRCELPFPPLE